MIKILLTLTLLLAIVIGLNLSMSSKAMAVDILPVCNSGFPNSPGNNSTVCNQKTPSTDPVITIIKAAIEVISFIAGAASVILIIVSAIKFITSGGDANAAASARSTLIYALIGIVIVILAQIIVVFVLSRINK